MKKNNKRKKTFSFWDIIAIVATLHLLYDYFFLGVYPNPLTITAFICFFIFMIYKSTQKFIKKKKLKDKEEH